MRQRAAEMETKTMEVEVERSSSPRSPELLLAVSLLSIGFVLSGSSFVQPLAVWLCHRNVKGKKRLSVGLFLLRLETVGPGRD